VLDIAVADALGLENSVARSRVLIAAAMAATRLLEIGEIETRQAVLATEVVACVRDHEETHPR
jgi:hypothetical protein